MDDRLTEEAINRIRQMELCFDTLQKAAAENPGAIFDDASFNEHLQALKQYFQSGQWLRDYELDEKHLLPPDLKRGVLSQDAVYNFLERLKEF